MPRCCRESRSFQQSAPLPTCAQGSGFDWHATTNRCRWRQVFLQALHAILLTTSEGKGSQHMHPPGNAQQCRRQGGSHWCWTPWGGQKVQVAAHKLSCRKRQHRICSTTLPQVTGCSKKAISCQGSADDLQIVQQHGRHRSNAVSSSLQIQIQIPSGTAPSVRTTDASTPFLVRTSA